MKIFILSLVLIFGIHMSAQDVIAFSYDDAGNRIKREVVEIVGIESDEPDEDMQKFLKSVRLEENVSITSDDSSNKIHIEFEGPAIVDGFIYSIHTLSGYTLIQGPSAECMTDVDISDIPKGIYVLVVSRNGQSKAWKIIKN